MVLFSAIFSGLNASLLALDIADLKRKAKLGNRQAKRVLPLRRDVHLTLASILFSNVAVVSATSIVLEHEFNGFIAGAISTLLIVIFGEVMPQALFAKNPLLWMARLSPLLRLIRFLTYPASKPLQLLLNRLFPPDKGNVLQTRSELGLLITEHRQNKRSELDEDEVEIIRGALQLSEKRVRDILTDIRQTYWLQPNTILNSAKIDEIKSNGYSRIPIFNSRLTICYGVLLVKDLVDVDFDEQVYRVDDIELHPTQLVGCMTALDTMFRKFMAAGSHLIPVEREDAIIGIITIEDLIEEIVGHEIEDETDRQKTNR